MAFRWSNLQRYLFEDPIFVINLKFELAFNQKIFQLNSWSWIKISLLRFFNRDRFSFFNPLSWLPLVLNFNFNWKMCVRNFIVLIWLTLLFFFIHFSNLFFFFSPYFLFSILFLYLLISSQFLPIFNELRIVIIIPLD